MCCPQVLTNWGTSTPVLYRDNVLLWNASHPSLKELPCHFWEIQQACLYIGHAIMILLDRTMVYVS